jgi:DNA (cytosine-5)-methyltransferase 1
MGLPEGWVTDPQHSELTNSQQITALGNGVLPLQAATAIGALRADKFNDQSDLPVACATPRNHYPCVCER